LDPDFIYIRIRFCRPHWRHHNEQNPSSADKNTYRTPEDRLCRFCLVHVVYSRHLLVAQDKAGEAPLSLGTASDYTTSIRVYQVDAAPPLQRSKALMANKARLLRSF
jgi:hypothetical protein